ncbi:hypothetical protein [Streptomyces sp. R17]|uniref:Uncharacterized protein n=1 Tax=Streptomyces sp. R17 TaxID=3238626 RepID=A0AB39NV85_9ACTN
MKPAPWRPPPEYAEAIEALSAVPRLDREQVVRLVHAEAELAPVVDAFAARYAQTFSRADDADLRLWLLRRLEIAGDRRAERYWHLLAVINKWPFLPSLFGPSALRRPC